MRLSSAMAISMALGSNTITALNTSSGRPPLPAATAAAAETANNRCYRCGLRPLCRATYDAVVGPGWRTPLFYDKMHADSTSTVRACGQQILSPSDHASRVIYTIVSAYLCAIQLHTILIDQFVRQWPSNFKSHTDQFQFTFNPISLLHYFCVKSNLKLALQTQFYFDIC